MQDTRFDWSDELAGSGARHSRLCACSSQRTAGLRESGSIDTNVLAVEQLLAKAAYATRWRQRSRISVLDSLDPSGWKFIKPLFLSVRAILLKQCFSMGLKRRWSMWIHSVYKSSYNRLVSYEGSCLTAD